ncbi:hypothetical protein BD310DRAFT_941332 [Dichomitus squalens]|uniref:Uncharacterized protein n=1 Tax=Dichomitus squalens TaxID=114155 RepID=A0A4Q9PB10_9APHY|nr:hypothetical protein BD310DRAFT_941332 [Dichomitus squalens]
MQFFTKLFAIAALLFAVASALPTADISDDSINDCPVQGNDVEANPNPGSCF